MSVMASGRIRQSRGVVWRLARALLLIALVVLLILTQVPARRAAAQSPVVTRVPNGFVGVNLDGPLFSANVNLKQQFDAMVASGVQTVRVVFNWAQAQPFQAMVDVPPDAQASYVDEGGIPTSFAQTDQIVAAAAAHGLAVLPTVIYAPGWDAGKNRGGGLAPPADPRPYGDYLRLLIGRYGLHGTFWQNHGPRMPIRSWQIWNEPNLSDYWPQPFASSYVKLLRVAHAAVKGTDPGANVVLGALTNYAWKYLGQIYQIRGAHGLFDVIAVNGFTATPSNEILFLQLVRRAINHLGDRNKPLLATEISWPSAVGKPVGHQDWDTTERGQARDISQLLPMLAADRTSLGLSSFYYFTWVSQDNVPARDDFSYAGLLRYKSSGQIFAKPALAAFRSAALRIEGCRVKGAQATKCAKPLR